MRILEELNILLWDKVLSNFQNFHKLEICLLHIVSNLENKYFRNFHNR